MTEEQRQKIIAACREQIGRDLDRMAFDAMGFGQTSTTSATSANDEVMTVEKLTKALNHVRVMRRQMNVVFVVEDLHAGPILQVSTADGTRFEMSWLQAREVHKHWPMRLHKVLSPDMAEFVPVSGLFGDWAPLDVPMPPYDMPPDEEQI